MQKSKNEFEQRVYNYSLSLIQLIKILPTTFISHVLSKQLLRSGTSIGANIFEARAASSKKDYINFFSYSLKSANESIFWLNLIKDSKLTNSTLIDKLIIETEEISRIIAKSVITMRKSK